MVGIFGKVLVTGRVEQVDEGVILLEAHHRCSYRDTPLALYLREVGGSVFLYLIALNGACHLYGTTEKQELFGKGGLTRIRVRNDGKRAPLGYFFFVHCALKGCKGTVFGWQLVMVLQTEWRQVQTACCIGKCLKKATRRYAFLSQE
jgi:hypothetical protein